MVVVSHEVEVKVVLSLASKLWEKCFVASVVTLKSFLALVLIFLAFGRN